MTLEQKKFDELLVESIDTVLCCIGEPVKNQFYIRLSNDYGIEKKDIPQKIEEFSIITHRIFGSGSLLLESKFMRMLYFRLTEFGDYSIEITENEMNFASYVKKMRNIVETL
jgi:hypothetical protein